MPQGRLKPNTSLTGVSTGGATVFEGSRGTNLQISGVCARAQGQKPYKFSALRAEEGEGGYG